MNPQTILPKVKSCLQEFGADGMSHQGIGQGMVMNDSRTKWRGKIIVGIESAEHCHQPERQFLAVKH